MPNELAIQSWKCFTSNKMNWLIAFFLVSALITVKWLINLHDSFLIIHFISFLLNAPKSRLSSPKLNLRVIRGHRSKSSILLNNAKLNATNTRQGLEEAINERAKAWRCAIDFIDFLSQEYDLIEFWIPYKEKFIGHLNRLKSCFDET